MKKNKMMRIASVLLVAVLLSTCAISGTFAKYITKETATASATVATWNVTIKDQDSDNFEFNLFDTIKSTNGANETNVAEGLIAPGTKGSFAIVVSNASQVKATYTTTFTVKVNGEALDEEANPFKFTADADTLTGELDMTDSATINVNWEWEFSNSDEANAADIALAGKTITVDVAVTVEQLD